MAKYRVVSITDFWGEKLPVEKMEFWYVDENSAIGNFKGYGFGKKYASYDGYTVITEKVEE